MLLVAAILGMSGIVLLLIAGYTLGVNRSSQSNNQLIEQNRHQAEELRLARAQLAEQQHSNAEEMRASVEATLGALLRHTDTMQKLVEPLTRREGDVEHLRNIVHQVLAPLAQRGRLAFELSSLSADNNDQQSLTRLLDQIAEKGQFWAVLLSNQDGLPLAASHNARDLNKLTAVSSLVLLLAERIGRDGAPAPLSVQIHDESNKITLCRIFQVNGQRLLLTAVSTGMEISPTALDPALAKVDSVLAKK